MVMLVSLQENQRILRRLFAIQLVSMGAMEMSGPFWPLHLRTLGNLAPQALAWASALAYAGPMFMAICFTAFWGRLGDRFGHKPMLLRALLALAMTQAWIATADDVLTVLAARLLQGALAGFIAAAQAYGAGLVARDARGRLMARLQVATAIGSAVGPMFGGWLFDQAGFRILNIVAAALCLACALLAMFALPVVPAQPPASKAADRGAPPFLQSALFGLLLAIALVQTGKMMPQTFFGLFAEQVLRAPAWLTGLCYGATALGLCLAAPLWGRHFDDRPRQSVLSRIELVCWACAAIVAVQAVSRDMTVFVLARFAWGVCLAGLLPVFYGLLSKQADAASQGRVLGLGNSAAKLGALTGAAAGGLSLAWLPVEFAFWPVAAVYVLTACGIRWIRKNRDRTTAVEDKAVA